MIKIKRFNFLPHSQPTSSVRDTMHYPEFHFQWVWTLKSSPEALWPLASNTNVFNRDTGLPSLQRRNTTDETGKNARRRLKIFRFGVPVEWEEEPFEWVRPYKFGVRRNYHRGPVAEMRTLAQLTPTEDGGTRLVYDTWARPRNLLGLIGIPVQISILSARAFAKTFRRYDKLASESQTILDVPGEVEFVPGGRNRLLKIRDELLTEGAKPEILNPIVETIERGDSLALARMRPYELADHWRLPRPAVLEHFLWATRHGVLELEWDVLCPLCRGAKMTASTLGQIRKEMHCDVCNIDFDINFDRSVELTFHPNAAIRHTQAGEFCIAGPQTTPHVVVQQLLPAGDGRVIYPALEPGRYRARTLGMRGGEFLQVGSGGLNEVTVRASTLDGWPKDELAISPTPILQFKNQTNEEQLFILERLAWTDQAVTAAEVTLMQTFRDLFANEALRPGEQISVGSLTIVFTDLRGSTRMYTEIGDAPAFGLVMNHFDVLRTAINAEGGAVVKTIGDAVMAVFRRPAPALRAMLNAQSMLAGELENGRPLHVRAGIHYGPCIAVTLNDRLDYFGSTVNLAARLESFSSGKDIIVSETVFDDPEVRHSPSPPS
jgi:class 3 adenylate cyclase